MKGGFDCILSTTLTNQHKHTSVFCLIKQTKTDRKGERQTAKMLSRKPTLTQKPTTPVLANQDASRDPMDPIPQPILVQLASLLRYHPPSSHLSTCVLEKKFLEEQRAAIEDDRTFPRELRARLRDSVTTMLRYPFADERFPPMCASHRRLNGRLVGHVYRLLRVEVSARCDRLRLFIQQSADPPGDAGRTRAVALRVVEDMSSIVGLYLSPEQVDRYFGTFRTARRFDLVAGGCPACVLAVVGGHVPVLLALRANLVARAGEQEPRLLRFVDAWVESYDARAAMRAESDGLVEALRRARTAVFERRNAKKRRLQEMGEKARPVPYKTVNGMLTPLVRMRGETAQQDTRSQKQQHPAASSGSSRAGSIRAESSRRPSERASSPDTWEVFEVSSVSSVELHDPEEIGEVSPISPHGFDDEEVDENGEYIPARRGWGFASGSGSGSGAPQSEQKRASKSNYDNGPFSSVANAGVGYIRGPGPVLQPESTYAAKQSGPGGEAESRSRSHRPESIYSIPERASVAGGTGSNSRSRRPESVYSAAGASVSGRRDTGSRSRRPESIYSVRDGASVSGRTETGSRSRQPASVYGGQSLASTETPDPYKSKINIEGSVYSIPEAASVAGPRPSENVDNRGSRTSLAGRGGGGGPSSTTSRGRLSHKESHETTWSDVYKKK